VYANGLNKGALKEEILKHDFCPFRSWLQC